MTTDGCSVQTSLSYDAWRQVLRGEKLPAAILDLDAFDRNAARIATHATAAGVSVRIATEALRVPRLIRRVLDLGKPYAGVLCFAAAEAELLASRGHEDLLLGYPTLQPKDLDTFVKLHEQDRNARVVVDSADAVELWAKVASGLKAPLAVVVDVDVSARLGPRPVSAGRSPMRQPADVVAIVEAIRAQPDLRFGGLLAQDAGAAVVTDGEPNRGMAGSLLRRARQRLVRGRRRAVVDALRARGIEVASVNGGAAGVLAPGGIEPWLTEITIGGSLLHGHGIEGGAELGLEPALFFALQAVRRPAPDLVSCHGGGRLAALPQTGAKLATPHLPAGLELVDAGGHGEMQTTVRGAATRDLELGDPVLFRPARPGDVAESFEELITLASGEIVDRAPTYRGLGCCFP